MLDFYNCILYEDGGFSQSHLHSINGKQKQPSYRQSEATL